VGEERETALVLVVDDQRDILGLIRFRLEQAGYEVVTATDGEQALGLVTSLRPNLVVLDVMLPVIDGREVTRRIRSDARTAGIPVLLVSASVHEHEVQEGLDAGADDYLPKPFTAEVLRGRVAALLERSPETSP
jgi:two-component system, OmpR family, alkaline phosphatase synthesis response regulator PhoP